MVVSIPLKKSPYRTRKGRRTQLEMMCDSYAALARAIPQEDLAQGVVGGLSVITDLIEGRKRLPGHLSSDSDVLNHQYLSHLCKLQHVAMPTVVPSYPGYHNQRSQTLQARRFSLDFIQFLNEPAFDRTLDPKIREEIEEGVYTLLYEGKKRAAMEEEKKLSTFSGKMEGYRQLFSPFKPALFSSGSLRLNSQMLYIIDVLEGKGTSTVTHRRAWKWSERIALAKESFSELEDLLAAAYAHGELSEKETQNYFAYARQYFITAVDHNRDLAKKKGQTLPSYFDDAAEYVKSASNRGPFYVAPKHEYPSTYAERASLARTFFQPLKRIAAGAMTLLTIGALYLSRGYPQAYPNAVINQKDQDTYVSIVHDPSPGS